MELFSLKNKVIVITGALGLLGQEHVKAIAMAGGNPILLDLNQKKLDNLAQKISKLYNVECYGYEVDITNERSVKKNCRRIVEVFGKIDGLINNAANNPRVEDNNKNNNFSRLENFPIEIWDQDLDVSLKGSFLCSKYYGFQISKNLSGGSIINVSSDLGLVAPNQNLYKKEGLLDDKQSVKPITYSITKHGIIGLTRYLSTYWADKKVRSNAICPGGVINNQNPEFIKKVSELIPLGSMAKKEDYHGLIIFLLSDSSSYINGSIIAADGGRTVW
tara:strand:- start:15488 stop:16312 length:825 start_codon:yes stop_codon:yes gene_type:complete